MTDHLAPSGTAHEVHLRPYLYVFIALLVGTALTVWAAHIHFGSHSMNIIVALVIATVKASLVAGYFMHLLSEKRLIYGVLLATAFFVTGLMVLTLWSEHDVPTL